MNILLLTGPLAPQPGNNANLISKLLPSLRKEHTVHFLASPPPEASALPDTLFGCPVHWASNDRRGLRRGLLWPAMAGVRDHGGYSDAIMAYRLVDAAKKLRKVFPFDAVLATMEPFPAALAASRLTGVRKLLYLMDPPNQVIPGAESTPFRRRELGGLLRRYDRILTTPFIRDALTKGGFHCENRIVSVGFPMLHGETAPGERPAGEKIHLLFCGWLYPHIRSPRYFLHILSRLDRRFRVTFMGRECELLRERFDFTTAAEVVTLPQQPYETALRAMAEADVLINIGNSLPVHMPSKTLEYINTGKPIVNFHKLSDCPTLHYTSRYPLCLNLYEGEGDIDRAAERFIRFCEENRGKTVDRDFILREYADCTPEHIAGKISEELGERND